MPATPPRSIVFTLRVATACVCLLPALWLRLRVTRDQATAFALVRDATRAALRLGGVRVDVRDLHHLPSGTHAMIVSNHVSLADAAILLAALPLDCRFVANHVFAGYPLLGAAIRAASANIVDRGSWRSRADSAQAMVDGLASGQSLLVFPEGTTSDGPMLRFRSGAFRAAAKTGRPVIPVALRGTREMLPNNTYRLANVPIEIVMLPAIEPTGSTREEVAALSDAVRAAIEQALGEREVRG